MATCHKLVSKYLQLANKLVIAVLQHIFYAKNISVEL